MIYEPLLVKDMNTAKKLWWLITSAAVVSESTILMEDSGDFLMEDSGNILTE